MFLHDVPHLVAQVQDVLEVLTHPMVLDGEEDSVEDDAERDNHVKKGVIDDCVENVLCFKPTFVV